MNMDFFNRNSAAKRALAVAQVSKPAVAPISKSAGCCHAGAHEKFPCPQVWKLAIQQTGDACATIKIRFASKFRFHLLAASRFFVAALGLLVAVQVRALDVNVPAGGNIQAAINQVAAAGGGSVNLTNGTWTLMNSLQMKSFVTLNGMGTNTILQGPLTIYNYPLVSDGGVEPLTNITVQNLVIDGRLPAGARLTHIDADGPYENVLAILFDAYTYDHRNILIHNVEAKNVGMGVHVKGTTGLVITNCYFHDNGISYWGSHNLYLRRDNDVVVTHTRSEYAHVGVGIHVAGGHRNWLFEKCVFIGNNGPGMNIQDSPENHQIRDCYIAYNYGDGMALTGTNNCINNRNRSEYNDRYGIRAWGGVGTNNCFTNNFSFDNRSGNYDIHGTYTQANNSSTKIPNLWEAELSEGATGLPNLADWVTTNSGYSGVGSVDFNATHLSDGALTWPNASVISAGTYPLRFRYANGSGATQTMQLTVNGAILARTLEFPPTANWSTWAFATNVTTLNAGNNTVQVNVVGSAAPNLDYLQVVTATPAVPAIPASLAAVAVSSRQINLSWNASPRAGTYNVKRATTSGGPYMVIASGVAGTNFNDANILFGGQTNYYVVSAVNAGGESANSAPVFAVTVVAAPGGFSAVADTGPMTLKWIASFGATGYHVKRATSSGGPYTTIASLANTADVTSSNNFYMTFTDTNVPSLIMHYYVVTGTNALGESENSYEMAAAKVINRATNGIASASSEAAQSAAQAFDKLASTKWFNNNGGATGWLRYQFGGGTAWAINRYDISSASDVPGRDPKNWQFQGSHNGTTWTTLDTRTDEFFPSRFQTRSFTFDNTTAYQYYRLNITANNGNATGIQLSELALYDVLFLPAPTTIVATMSARQLQLTWPFDHIGWLLQAQTNSLATGLGTNWTTVSGSASTNQMFIPINTGLDSVFFRLISP